MRITLSITLLNLALISTTPIVKAQSNPTDRIYWNALNEYTRNLDSSYLYKSDPNKRIIYLQKPDYVDSITPNINGFKITLIIDINKKDLYRNNHNRLTHTTISPVMVKDSLIYISIVPFSGSRKGRNYHFLISDGTTIY